MRDEERASGPQVQFFTCLFTIKLNTRVIQKGSDL
jgi:hypothetical protein